MSPCDLREGIHRIEISHMGAKELFSLKPINMLCRRHHAVVLLPSVRVQVVLTAKQGFSELSHGNAPSNAPLAATISR